MKIGIFGGDKRMLFAARAFADDGHEVYAAGFDRLVSLCEIQICDYREAARQCDIAVLPVRPVTKGCLHTPFSEENITIAALAELIGEKPVFTGNADLIAPAFQQMIEDYATREVFAMQNARLTAEGAVGILIQDYEGSIAGCDVLITGYGRIGKALSALLSSMGANVAVAARKSADREQILQNGMKALEYPLIAYSDYSVIINTVPAMVLDRKALDEMRSDSFIIDLASAPGGVDFAYAKERDMSCIHALSLPGKTAPLAAGRIIKDTIMNILSRD